MTVQTLTYRCPHCQHPMDVELGTGNELLVCPNEACKKPFKVDAPRAKPVAELVLPPGAHETDADDQAVGTAAPVARPATEIPEQTLRIVRLSMFRRYPFRCSAYLLLTAASLVGVFVFLVWEWTFLALVSVAVGLVAAYRFLAWWLRMQNITLTVTNKRCILESGVFSKETVELPLSDIEDIQVTQSFVQRYFDVGDLILSGKKTETQKLVVMAVPTPGDVATVIRDQRLP